MANDNRPQQQPQGQRSGPQVAQGGNAGNGSPPVAASQHAQSPLAAATEAFLTKHGWEKISQDDVGNSFWADPLGNMDKPKELVTGRIPMPDGGEVPLKQLSVNPLPWTCSMAEAAQTQRDRNRSSQQPPAPTASR